MIYSGSCHCGKVKYQVDLDLSKGTGRCNCSYCAKVRNWSASTKPENFKLLSSQDDLGDYHKKGSSIHHMFCKHCGVRMFTLGYVEAIGGHFVSVTISTIDNLSDQERAELKVKYMDGKNDNWFLEPEITKHL